MLHQASVGRWPNPAQQDEIQVVFIANDFEIVSRLYSPARSNRFRYYELATWADVSRHEV